MSDSDRPYAPGAVATTKTFQERMFEKVREQIGDLMTPADLKAIVDSAMQRAFFEREQVGTTYGGNPDYRDPVFIRLIRELLAADVREALKQWIADHPGEVERAIRQTIEKGVSGMVLSHFEYTMQGPLMDFQQALRSKGLI